MDRSIIAPLEQMRDFDFVQFEHDVLCALGDLAKDCLSQLNSTATATTTVAGFAASQSTPSANLSVVIGTGRIYTLAQADATSDGSITTDATIICQQGRNAGQTLTLVPPSAGQSQWNLIQCSFQQQDAVRAGDPNNGIVPFFNAANPAQPNNTSVNTVRLGNAVLQVITGSAATTGSEVPPTPTSGWVPLYLIDLAGGQTQITTAQIIVAGPSVGTGVPANYPFAPFLAGFQRSHHSGNPGQAPKVNLATEVQGVLPYVNMAPVRQVLNANLTLFVNGTTGNDSNPGTSGAPFKTIQAAYNAAMRLYDLAGNTVTISVANGTYTAGVVCVGLPPGSFGTIAQVPAPLQPPPIQFVGNQASPGSVVINATNSNGFVATGSACISINGFTITASGTSANYNVQGIGIYAFNSSSIQFQNVVLGACSNGHIAASASSFIETGGQPYTVAGNAPYSVSAAFGSTITLVASTVTLSGTPAFSNYFATAQACGVLQANSMTFVGSATGVRYSGQTNGVILTGGGGASYFPGNAAGSAATGGQYT